MTEDRDKWRKYVHSVANPRIEDGWRSDQRPCPHSNTVNWYHCHPETLSNGFTFPIPAYPACPWVFVWYTSSGWNDTYICTYKLLITRTIVKHKVWIWGAFGCLQCCKKNWVVGCWRGYLSGARCRLAYGKLMPLPLTVSCFSKIQIGFTFLVPAHLGSPGQRAVKRCVCVCAGGC